MEIQSLQETLINNEFTLSDLGDETAVLTSLSNSQIISLNKVGTTIVSALLNSDSSDKHDLTNILIEAIEKKYAISSQKAKIDLAHFVNELRNSIDSKQ